MYKYVFYSKRAFANVFQPRVTVYWDGWSDADSGVEEYVFDIYQLKMTTKSGPLIRGNMLTSTKISATYVSMRK